VTRSDQQRRAIERWLRHRGLPAVVRGRQDNLLVRIVPAIVWFVLADLLYAVLTAVDGDAAFESRLANPAFAAFYNTVLVGSVTLPAVGAWLATRWSGRCVVAGRGSLPALTVAAGYVVAEPLVSSAFGDPDVLLGVVRNLCAVALVLGLTAVGVGSIFCWALRAALRQLRDIGTMTSRAMPLLFLVMTFGFYTTEIWQISALLPRARMWWVLGFFAALGSLFLCSVLSAELRTLTSGARPPRDLSALAGQPFDGPTTAELATGGPAVPLSRLERANMVFVLVLTEALQALVFGVLVFLLFVILGQLSVPSQVIKSWTTRDPVQGVLFGIQLPVPNELVHVCMFLAAFSALYFVATVVTDTVHRKAFFDPILDHLELSLAARAVYLSRFVTPSVAAPAAAGEAPPTDDVTAADQFAEPAPRVGPPS
jgi:hypothetical protein